MGLKLLTGPSTEPISLSDIKLYLRVDSGDEDALLTALVSAARERAEHDTNRQFITAQYKFLTGDDQTNQNTLYDQVTNRVYLPKPPLIGVSDVHYYDGSGSLNPVDPSEYRVVTSEEPGYIVFKDIPSYDPSREDAVQITYTAGYGSSAASVPQGLIQAMKWIIGQAYGTRTESEAASDSSIKRLLDVYRVFTS